MYKDTLQQHLKAFIAPEGGTISQFSTYKSNLRGNEGYFSVDISVKGVKTLTARCCLCMFIWFIVYLVLFTVFIVLISSLFNVSSFKVLNYCNSYISPVSGSIKI